MRTQQYSRLGATSGVLAIVSILIAFAAPTALAKEGVEVALAAPISRDAKPGDTVAVFFTLGAISDAGTTPLRGSDVFIRLYGPTGVSTQAAGAEQSDPGLYKALIVIPAGGAARAEFGLHGTAKDASGEAVASDIVWPYDGILVAAAIPAPVQLDPAGGTAAGPKPAVVTAPQGAAAPTPAETSQVGTATLDPRLALGAAIAMALAIAGALALGRRRRTDGSPA